MSLAHGYLRIPKGILFGAYIWRYLKQPEFIVINPQQYTFGHFIFPIFYFSKLLFLFVKAVALGMIKELDLSSEHKHVQLVSYIMENNLESHQKSPYGSLHEELSIYIKGYDTDFPQLK